MTLKLFHLPTSPLLFRYPSETPSTHNHPESLYDDAYSSLNIPLRPSQTHISLIPLSTENKGPLIHDQRLDLRVEQIAGIQSTKLICTGIISCGASDGGLACFEMVAASSKRKKDSANYVGISY